LQSMLMVAGWCVRAWINMAAKIKDLVIHANWHVWQHFFNDRITSHNEGA